MVPAVWLPVSVELQVDDQRSRLYELSCVEFVICLVRRCRRVVSRLLVVRVPAYVKVMSKSESTLVVVIVYGRVLVASMVVQVVRHQVDMMV